MKRFLVFVFILSFVFVQSAFAETSISNTKNTSSSSGSGTNSTAKQAGGGAQMAQMVSIATAAATLPMCPAKPMMCVVGVANLAAAVLAGGAKKNAGSVEKATQASTSGGSVGSMPGSSGTASVDGTDTSGIDAELAALTNEYAALGYTASPDGSSITVPGAGTVATKDLASGNVPGFEMTDEMKSELAKIEAEAMKNSGARVVAVGLQEGGGGGGSAMGGGDNSSKFDMAAYLKKLKNRDPSSVSGLSKKLGEDNIGIKSDNIFEMVSRQYKRKQSQSAFIN